MNIKLKEEFLKKWKKYFPGADLPIVFYYTEGDGGGELVKAAETWSCIIGELFKVRKGKSLCYCPEAVACGGAKKFLGFAEIVRPDFEYFLSCGIPGKVKGELYKKKPEIVKEMVKRQKHLPVEGKNIVFKRWDNLNEKDGPDAVIFFAKSDVLSGLFTLANFDQPDVEGGVFAPFSAGCGSIVHYPFLEKDSDNPRAIIGMFDPSARPCVAADELSFAVPMNKFERMIGYMDESFLVTDAWEKVKKRIGR